jgi:1,2-diacylglycerol 3-alpha-glucosyltransferase
MEQMDSGQSLARGEALFATGNLEEAEACFLAIMDTEPENPEVMNNLGVLAFQRQDFEKAGAHFRKAIDLDKNCLSAIENLTEMLILTREFEQAAEIIRDAYKGGAISPALLAAASHCFLETGDRFAARCALNHSLRLRSEDAPHQTPLHHGTSKRLKVGFVTIWFERGQAYVSRILRDALSATFDTYIFARTGTVYGESKLEIHDYWDVPNLTTYHDYRIPPRILQDWITGNHIDAVIFNEEYDWDLVTTAKQAGAKVLTYLDYYKADWEPRMPIYDAVLCSTLRTFHLVRGICAAEYIGWAVDPNLFTPKETDTEKYTFFHNAGWLGINFRKMTPAVILAFDAISKDLPDISLFVHAQVGLDKLPPTIVEIIKANHRIRYHVETVPAPGLYHKGRVLLFPTKLEGLGLPLFEAMACGLPAIATDAPPMNEFIKNGYNGFLVRVAHSINREDAVAFPETLVDINDLALKMGQAASDAREIRRLSENARTYAKTDLDPDILRLVLSDVMRQLLSDPKRTDAQ